MAHEQEIFDIAAVGLLKQKEKSKYRTDPCKYRGPDNKKCAIGFCISDKDYEDSMEGKSIRALLDGKYSGLSLDKLRFAKLSFLEELQDIHDYFLVESWRINLIILARNYGLNTSAIDNL